MAYTTEVAVENYLQIDIDNSFSSQITEWIAAADKYINNYCNQPQGFEQSSGGVKYYDIPETSKELLVDQFTALTQVQVLDPADNTSVDYTLAATTDYVAYPLNDTNKYKLVLSPNGQIINWQKGVRVKITGTWAGVTEDIKLASTMLVAKIIEKGLKGGTVVSESLGDYSVTYADVENVAKEINVAKLLAPYRNWTV